MTTASDLLTLAEQYGIEMYRDGNRIRLRAPAPPPSEVVETLRQHKVELLRALAHRRAYRFRLRNGEGGGTYLTEAATVADARRELLKRYGDRLLIVTAQGADHA